MCRKTCWKPSHGQDTLSNSEPYSRPPGCVSHGQKCVDGRGSFHDTLSGARGVKPSDSIHTMNNGLRNLMIISEHWSSPRKRGTASSGGAGPRYFGTLRSTVSILATRKSFSRPMMVMMTVSPELGKTQVNHTLPVGFSILPH